MMMIQWAKVDKGPRPAGPGAESTSAGSGAEGVGPAAGPGRQNVPGTLPDPEEEYQISRDKGQVMDAIDAFFALADDNNVCIRCGESGHTNYECGAKDDDPVKMAIVNLRKKLQGGEAGDEPQGGDSKEPQRVSSHKGKEYMFLRPLPLSVIGDRAHGELSINGVKIDEKGHATRNALNQPVDIASQRGITMTCKDVIEAGKYSDHKMYRKLPVKTSVGKLKILPLKGGKFYSKNFAGAGVEFPLPTDENTNQVILDKWEDGYSYYFNTALRHHVGKERVREKGIQYYRGLRCDEAG